MNAIHAIATRPTARRPLGARTALGHVVAIAFAAVLAACGGADAPPPPEDSPTVQPVPPAITQQPANATVGVGQTATFSVAATGTAPLAYQWQRNGAAIAGATSASYTTPAAVLGDSGATFRAVVSNVAGSATSNNATLTVTVAAPVLTITQQPANLAVVAGAQATFTVAATCSAGTLTVQWQRANGAGAFADVAGATATSIAFASAIGDSGARFRAALTCSQQAATTSNAATLTVTSPSAVTVTDVVANTTPQGSFDTLEGIGQAPDGSWVFVTERQLKRLSADLAAITPVAGSTVEGNADGPAASATFTRPSAVAFDAAGNVYVTDRGGHTIRRISTTGTVTTLAGTAGTSGLVEGTGTAARFSEPGAIAVGPDGDVYVADTGNHRIRRVTPAGVVTTYAGSSAGYADGAAAAAQFVRPNGVAFTANGDLLVADTSNNRVRRVLRNGATAGNVETLAGDGTRAAPYPDGVGTAAVLPDPSHMVVSGNALVLRNQWGLVRQIDLATLAVTTLGGSRTLGPGYSDGSLATARIDKFAVGIATAPGGGFLLADFITLRTLSAAGDVRTIAHAFASQSGVAGTGTLDKRPLEPFTIALDSAGRVAVGDARGTVRRVAANGDVSLAAGLFGGGPERDGRASEAQFANLGAALTADSAGNLWVADSNAVRRIGADNVATTVAGSAATSGYLDGAGTAARFNTVSGLATAPGGIVYVSDLAHTVRRIDAGGNVTTYAGVSGQGTIVDGPIATARFNAPGTLALAPDGALHVLERSAGVIRRIAPDGLSVATVAGPANVVAFAIDSAGTIHYGTAAGGLMSMPLGGTPSLTTSGVAVVNAMFAVGPKDILVVSGGRALRVVLP